MLFEDRPYRGEKQTSVAAISFCGQGSGVDETTGDVVNELQLIGALLALKFEANRPCVHEVEQQRTQLQTAQ
jgi:hypothetical protein